MMPLRRLLSLLLALALPLAPAHGAEVKAAVAANFTPAIKRLAPLFNAQSGHTVVASFGATGQLYAQIRNGAPFDVFLSADTAAPRKLVDEGVARADSLFVYARGRLALWSALPGRVDADGAILRDPALSRLALANPQTAPYGQAAVTTLTRLGLFEVLKAKLVTGESIAQAQQFVASGNVPVGFIALAQVRALPPEERGSWWLVPETLHEPLDQAAVQLAQAADAGAATAFLAFLRSPEALAVLRELGYEQPPH